MTPAIDAYDARQATGCGAALRSGRHRGRGRPRPRDSPRGAQGARQLSRRASPMGHQDPGATSTTILFESLRDAVAAG